MSRALVISKTQTYWPKISSATPVTLPVSALIAVEPRSASPKRDLADGAR